MTSAPTPPPDAVTVALARRIISKAEQVNLSDPYAMAYTVGELRAALGMLLGDAE